VTCTGTVEGTSAFYGGNTPADNSGRLRYIQIKYSGFEISTGNELQGLTLGGVGSGTTIDHIQVYNSSDDGIEIFGGNANLRHIVINGADDDGLDTDTGWRGGAQFGEAAAACLVPGELRALGHQHVRARTRRGDRRGGPRGPRAAHEHVDLPHAIPHVRIHRSGHARTTRAS
jgi:hypothetical protein